jgi:hypothetical protein
MTKFIVAIYRHPAEPKIGLGQVTKWAEPPTKDGPAEIAKSQRVRGVAGPGLIGKILWRRVAHKGECPCLDE